MAARNGVFVSYARADSRWLDLLETHLKPLAGRGVNVWIDRSEIAPGDRWQEKIDQGLETSAIAVLLVTPRFFSSDYIRQYEFQRILDLARARRLTLLWVAVEDTVAAPREALAPYQALNDPRHPLAGVANPSAELVRVADAVWRCAERVILKRGPVRYVPVFHSRRRWQHVAQVAAAAIVPTVASGFALNRALPGAPDYTLGQWALLWLVWFGALLLAWPLGLALGRVTGRARRAGAVGGLLLAAAVAAWAQPAQPYFRVEPPVVRAGQQAILSWGVPRGYRAFIEGPYGPAWAGQEGAVTFTPGQSVRYRLTVCDLQGRALHWVYATILVDQRPVGERFVGGGGPSAPDSSRADSVAMLALGLLEGAEDGPPGYGMYSYVLMTRLTPPPVAAAVIDEVVQRFGTAECYLRQGAQPGQLNLLLIPVRSVPRFDHPPCQSVADPGRLRAEAESIYGQYNTYRAELLLARLGLAGVGPYLITVPYRISAAGPLPADYLRTDLTGVSPAMARALVGFFAESARLRSVGRGRSALQEFALSVRLWLERNAPALGAVPPQLALIGLTQ